MSVIPAPAPERAEEFVAEPLTQRCRLIWQRGEHALIGVSSGNSYFSRERLTGLLNWARRHFGLVDVVYADLHIDTTLAAFGCPEDQAGRRGRKRVTDVRRRIRQAVESADGSTTRCRVRALSEFTAQPEYQAVRAWTDHALETDREFAGVCEDMVRRYLASYQGGSGEDIDARKMNAGLSYLRAELPFFVDTPAILDVPSSVSCYHRSAPLVRQLYTRGRGLAAAPNQAFMVVRPVTGADSSGGEG